MKIVCVPIDISVNVAYLQQSVVSAYRYNKVIEYSSSFTQSYNRVTASAQNNISLLKLFSGSAKLAYEHVIESVSRSTKYGEEETSEKTNYNPNFLQIVQIITKAVSINGNTARTISTDFVDSVPTEHPLSSEELTKKAEKFIRYHYGHLQKGTIDGDTFSEEECVKVKGNMKMGLCLRLPGC